MTPLNATEWLEAIRLGPDPAADFAAELLAMAARMPDADAFDDIMEDMTKAAGRTFDEPWRMVEFFTERHHILCEAESQLADAGYPGDVDDAVANLLADLRSARADLEAEQEAYRNIE